MPLLPCPKCATNLKVPDGATAAVRCPKCQTVFKPPAARAKPAFEVVDDAPPPKAAPRPAPKAAPLPAPKPAPRPAPKEEDFEPVDDPPPPPSKRAKALSREDEDDDRPRRKRRDDDEDDDRPRSKRRRDDEDDDRPRKKRRDDEDDDDRPRGRRGRDDDYDDDDDRGRGGRRKRGRDDDDYDDYDDYGPRRKRNPFGPAKVGALLLSISFWINCGVFGILALFMVLLWADSSPPEALATITGLVAVGAWATGAVGIGFSLAGPKKAWGVTLAAAIVAGVHLILMVVVFANADGGGGGGRRGGGFGLSGSSFLLFAVMIPAFDLLLPALIYESKVGFKISGDLVLPALAGACEIARLILVLISLKLQGAAAKDFDVGAKAKVGITTTASACGGGALLLLLVVVIVVESEMRKGAQHMLCGFGLLLFLAYAGMYVMPALAALDAKNAFARKAKARR